MKVLSRTSCLMLVALAIAGCANPFAEFYRGGTHATTVRGYDPSETGVRVVQTQDVSRDRDVFARKSYVVLGAASFNGKSGQIDDAKLIDQGKKLGAQVVLVSSKHTGTVQTVVPFTIPTSTTSYSSGQATAYGAAGTVNAYGNATTTTYGTSTTMVPVAVSQSDYVALFLVKVKQRVGAVTTALDDATRKRIGTNQGVLVELVVEDSPAFYSDIFSGDVILTVAGEPVFGREGYTKLLDKYEGQRVLFRVNRDGNTIDKEMEIRSYASK